MTIFISFPIKPLDKILTRDYDKHMDNPIAQLQNSVLAQALRLELPPRGNYHDGLLLPEGLELPDNILCFYHNFPSRELQHNRYCIVIPFDRIEYVLNGVPLDILPGTAIFQCPYAAHCIRPKRSACRRLQISFDLFQQPNYFPDCNVTAAMGADAWRKVARILRLFLKHDAPGCALEIYRFCMELKGRGRDSSFSHKRVLLAEVEHMTEFRRTRRENVKSIAQHMQMSESNLRLRFRRENGVSLGRFLQQHKLEIALYRLKYTRQSVGEIAKVCGYDSPFSFSRFFKSRTGLSPRQWRARQQTHLDAPPESLP